MTVLRPPKHSLNSSPARCVYLKRASILLQSRAGRARREGGLASRS